MCLQKWIQRTLLYTLTIPYSVSEVVTASYRRNDDDGDGVEMGAGQEMGNRPAVGQNLEVSERPITTTKVPS
ncbi:hypothetical protein J3F83DRAFT_743639, partial [Trichoderma novae-zelandiae]